MLENQIAKLQAILSDEDLQNYAGDGFWNLIQAVVTSDPFSGATAMKNAKELVFHMPTVLFWDKMKRYLTKTFHCYKDQVKMAGKFYPDQNVKYQEFVKRQIHLLNSLDDDMKVDFFAALTRCFLLTELELPFFSKLSKFISICTVEELLFLKDCPADYKGGNSVMISSLYRYGLFVQDTDDDADTTYYELSDFAQALKQNCLNFDDGLKGNRRVESYEQMKPLNILEVASDPAINALLGKI